MKSEVPEKDPIGCLIIPSLIFVVPATIFWVWKLFVYLKDGRQIEISVLETLHHIGIEWAANPKSWFGIHQLLTDLSLLDFLAWTGLILMIPFFMYLAGNK